MPKERFLKEKFLNPICEICSGTHKTSMHNEYKKEVLLNVLKCKICGGEHEMSAHDLE